MDYLYNFINQFKEIKIKDSTIIVIESKIIIYFDFYKKINLENPLIDELKSPLKNIRIRKYKNECNNLVQELYVFLSIHYFQNNKIPKYSLNYDEKNQNKLFFDIDLQIDDNFNLTDLIIFISKIKNNIVTPLKNKKFYIHDYKLSESSEIGIIQSNTKTRRLAYLKHIIELFENSNYYPITYLGKKIESDAIILEKDLIDYGKFNTGDDKGLIKKTTTGSSAKPYVDLLEELNLLTQINNSFILTKQSKIYFHLNKYFKQNNNLFQLNTLDKLFFLRQILITDPLYTWAIIDIIFIIQKPVSTMTIKKVFVDFVKNELELNQQFSKNNIAKKKIIELRNRISSWKKPLTYLEHIVEPRINWLVDLGILELKTESKEKLYFFTTAGLNLVFILSQIFETNSNKQLILNSYLSNNYLYIFNHIFDLNKNNTTLNHSKIEQYFLEAFKIFKTNAPNKIAASQGIDYVCFKLFLEDDVIIEFDELKKYLQESNNKFSMDWFKSENDGALFLKKIN